MTVENSAKDQQLAAQDQQLQEQIEQAREELATLESALQSVDRELESLAGQREQHSLLNDLCKSLDRLEELGASALFWGEHADAARVSSQVANARQQAEDFFARATATVERRNAIVAKIHAQDDTVANLDDALHELRRIEEMRKAEWVVEREAELPRIEGFIMPWSRGCEEDRRFQRYALGSVLGSLLVGLLISLIDLPIPDRAELMEVPERVAKLIAAPKPPPPKTVVEEQPPEQQPEPKPEEPVLVEERPPEELPEVVEPAAQVAEQAEAPKQEVRSKGILAFRDSFAKRANAGPSAELGSQARVGNTGDASIGRPQRSMVTTTAPGSSGGINLASISRDVGGGAGGQQMAGVQVSQVASSIGGNGSADRPLAGGGALAGRTDEEIQIVFDRYKASLYRLYNRELRRDPTLRGQLVLRLTIEPDGSVSMCSLQSTDMNAPILADQVVSRVQAFDFGAKPDISAMTILYPIDFLPAAS